MAQTLDIKKVIPNTLKTLVEAGSEGMEAQKFFESCRINDRVDAPIEVLKDLVDLKLVAYEKYGSNPLTVVWTGGN